MLQFTEKEIQKFRDICHIKELSGVHEKRLLAKTQKYTWLFRLCPGIQMVAVGNSVAMDSAHESSDIDLFIVTEKNRLWYVRVFLTLVFNVLGERKTAKKHAGKFCLSFFITDENLSLGSIAIENDIYLYWWILTLKPIVNNNKTYEKFIELNTQWCDFSSYSAVIEDNKKYITHRSGTWGTGWKLLDMKNWGYTMIFLPRTLKSFEKLGRPEGVVITESILKFHDKDKRRHISSSIFNS